jgi:hypothetical protein
MAISLEEMYKLRSYAANLRTRIASALIIAAYGILWEGIEVGNHDKRLLWCNTALVNPEQMADKMIWLVIMSSEEVKSAGESVSDEILQTAVNNAVAIYLKLFE